MPLNPEQIYLVGGAVRDALLGIEVKDQDWVVVGSTPEEMVAAGYRPVGKDFPVFIDPKTSEEYALARTERKSGKGYKGFTFHTDPSVTLEQDLIRRDLRINAIAKSQTGELIDPYGGVDDLNNRLLRHVSPAFAEDPLRVLRVARFAARFADLGFRVANETLELMAEISRSGELEALTTERVWQELERALNTPRADQFFSVLQQANSLNILFPEFIQLEQDQLQQLANALLESPEARFALLVFFACTELDELKTLCQRLKTPNRYRDLSIDLLMQHERVINYDSIEPEEKLALINELKLQKSTARLDQIKPICEVIYNRSCALESLDLDIRSLALIEPKTLIQEGFKGAELGQELQRRQIAALRH